MLVVGVDLKRRFRVWFYGINIRDEKLDPSVAGIVVY